MLKDCWKECRWNESSGRRREKAQIVKTLEVKEVEQVTETKEEKKNGETCGEGFICPWSRASRSSPAVAQALACQLGWTPGREKTQQSFIQTHRFIFLLQVVPARMLVVTRRSFSRPQSALSPVVTEVTTSDMSDLTRATTRSRQIHVLAKCFCNDETQDLVFSVVHHTSWCKTQHLEGYGSDVEF